MNDSEKYIFSLSGEKVIVHSFEDTKALSSPSKITLQKTVLLIGVALLLFTCFCGPAYAANHDDSCGDGVYYRLDKETGVLEIFGNGKIYDYKSGNAPWNKSRTDITTLIIQPEITYIGNNAFNGCTNLKTVIFPESFQNQFYNSGGDRITAIGERAFYNCKSLTTFKIPKGISSIGKEAFFNCSSLTTLTIPPYVTSIGASAFGGCTKLTEILVDEKNKHFMSIDGVLYDKIEALNQPETLLSYPLGKPETEYTIPSPVKTIAASAFKNCSTLTAVTISGSVSTIETEAFYNCKNLTYVELPNAITTIQKNVFAKCSSLKSIEFPLTTAKICAGAFKDCSSLETVLFPEKSQLEIIEDEAFSGCSHLTKIELPDSLRTVGKNTFKGLADNSIIYYHSGMSQTSGKYQLEKTAIAKESSDHTYFTFYVHTKIANGKLLLNENNVPTKEDYTFLGWYADEDYKTVVTEIPGNSDMVLYPKWIKTVLLPETTPTPTPTATPTKKPTAAPTKTPTPVPTKQPDSSSGKDTQNTENKNQNSEITKSDTDFEIGFHTYVLLLAEKLQILNTSPNWKLTVTAQKNETAERHDTAQNANEDVQQPEKTTESKETDNTTEEKTTVTQFGFNVEKYHYQTWSLSLQNNKNTNQFFSLLTDQKTIVTE